MRSLRIGAARVAAGVAISAVGLAGTAAVAGAATSRSKLAGSQAPAAARKQAVRKVPATAAVSFNLMLTMKDAAGAQALVRTVSDPASPSFRHYVTRSQWISRYAPAQAEVSKASAWLRQQGFKVGAVPKDRLFVPASGSAALVEKTFATTLSYYKVNGATVRLAESPLSIPSSMAGTVTGAVGVNQSFERPNITNGQSAATGASRSAAVEPPPPAGFRNPRPCSNYWGQKIDTADAASLFTPFTAPLPYDICGYRPPQLRTGYGLGMSVQSGNDGSGVTIGIVDAYESPTLLSDATNYTQRNDPSHVLTSSQFSDIPPATVQNADLCDGSGWYAEQSLDVESSHSMAPGADILFVGARDCFDNNLIAAEQSAIDGGAQVISNSFGDTAGDLLVDTATRNAWDTTFMLADTTGVSILFSSGDSGDNFADTGLTVPDFPATSPFITSVGGTTLEVGTRGTRQAEYGWSTAKETLCLSPTTNCGSQTTPSGTLAWQAGGGGGTSYFYTQPYYQAGVVPDALALRNQALFGPTPLRVEPDISMDGDAQSGMLIGLTQTFPDGVYYDQFKEGGTSLASPLMAGVVADADQAAGGPIGFLNPALYKAYKTNPAAFNDILSPADPKKAAVSRVDYVNTVDNTLGYAISLRAINYKGTERYCDGTGNCASRPVTLVNAKGFDSLTGLGSAAGTKFINTLKNF
jgi:subtilase family serine protease